MRVTDAKFTSVRRRLELGSRLVTAGQNILLGLKRPPNIEHWHVLQ